MTKPIIKIPLTKIDWALEAVTALALITLLAITAAGYNSLPETIPTHFNATGDADQYGSRQSIWIIPLATLVMYAALTIFERFPHKFNYLLEITTENAERQYRNMLYMMRALKVLVIILLLYVTYMITQIALGNHHGMGGWFLPIILLGLLSTVVIFIHRSYRLK